MFRMFELVVKLVAAVATISAVMLAAATPSQAQTGAIMSEHREGLEIYCGVLAAVAARYRITQTLSAERGV